MTDLITIRAADLSRIEAELSGLREILNRVEIAPRPKWLSVPEYASRCGVTPTTVRRWIKCGKVQTSQRGGQKVVRVEG